MMQSADYARAGAGIVVLIVSRAYGQAPVSPPLPSASPSAFEVATIKPTNPEFRGIMVDLTPGGIFSTKGFTLNDLIGFAYDVDNRQIVDGPKWSDSDRYDVLGKMEATSSPSPDNAKRMLQTLLAERFQLKIHREPRDMPVYVMTVAKNGVKMKPSTQGDDGAGGSMPIQGAKIPGRDTTVQFLATGLQKLVLDRPVLDETGLTGGFDFILSWRPDPSQFHGMGDKVKSDPNDPDLFTAMQEQLGLKLTAQKGVAPVIVVDHADKPSDN